MIINEDIDMEAVLGYNDYSAEEFAHDYKLDLNAVQDFIDGKPVTDEDGKKIIDAFNDADFEEVDYTDYRALALDKLREDTHKELDKIMKSNDDDFEKSLKIEQLTDMTEDVINEIKMGTACPSTFVSEPDECEDIISDMRDELSDAWELAISDGEEDM